MDWSNEEFGRRLRIAREAIPSGKRPTRPISRERAAVALGLTRNTLDNYERGVTSPTLMTTAQMARFYGVSLGWLIGVSAEGGPAPKSDLLADAQPTDRAPRDSSHASHQDEHGT